ncbi:MAG TPA: hypothetical protein VF715_19630 [Thermoleophilaceae bacterium]
MSLDRCLFMARTPRAAGREELRERIERLARWHGGRASWAWVGECGVAGVVRYDGREESLAEPLVFGEEPSLAEPPASGEARASAAALLDGTPRLEGATAVLAVEPSRAGIVAGASGPGTLFEASSGAADAWSTHAVAAAWLAHGRARVDTKAIPEQLAAEFVGGARTLVEGARALPGGIRVTVADSGARLDDLWPLADRWAPVPEEDAAAHAERALLESLERRVPGRPHVSLTAGLDSRVVGVALRELGIGDAHGFTWGEDGWEDVRGGRDLAERLGMPHSLVAIEWLSDDGAFAEVGRQVRWNEGAIQVGFARLRWPAAMPGFVTGAGGEVGRAFYYRDSRPPSDEASAEELVAVLARLLEPRLAGARGEAVEALRASLNGWVDAAAAAGRPGWRTLDVVYGEQRVRRWLRGMLPRLDAPMIPAFATPEIGRALASLPLADRVSDGFHRGYLERHAPELLPPRPAEPEPRRAGLAELLRRGAPDRLRARLRTATPSELGTRWDERPGFRNWIAEGVLGSPLLTEPLGERWARRTRDRFLAGDGQAEAMALAAGGPVALAEALVELERTRAGA